MSDTWRDGIHRMAMGYAESYREDKGFIEVIKNTAVPKEILRMLYNELVREGLTRLEDLPKEKKKELAAEVGECENLKEVCRGLYVMKTILSV